MKSFMNFTYILGITLLFINATYAKAISNNGKKINNEDKYYLIYVNNTYGEYKVFSNPKNQKREESQVFVESLVDRINSLIINNKDTYQNPEVLNEIEEASQLRKRNLEVEEEDLYNYNESDFVYPISSVNDRVILYAYLSKPLSKKVFGLDNVMACVPNKYTTVLHHKNYNKQDILKETGWENLEVRENADLHLSLISQGKYNKTLVNQYDTNYYYPSSAGKDIDIVILDSSFHFQYSEFKNSKERTVKCAGNVMNGKVDTFGIERNCGSSKFNHGEVVSDTAAGYKHGAANLANVYGISLPTTADATISDADIFGGLQFIYENLIRPHKTVVNLSIGGGDDGTSEYYKQYKELMSGISRKGGIIVASAGNDGLDMGELDYYVLPCRFDEVLCVGGISNKRNGNMDEVYEVSEHSNYGEGVDIYSPFHVTTEIVQYNKRVEKVLQMGTSFSAPLVSGMIATIMSENPDVIFTKETIYEKLYEFGQNEIVTFNNGTGILANNGKRIVYSKDGKYNGCGVYAGNVPCTEN